MQIAKKNCFFAQKMHFFANKSPLNSRLKAKDAFWETFINEIGGRLLYST